MSWVTDMGGKKEHGGKGQPEIFQAPDLGELGEAQDYSINGNDQFHQQAYVPYAQERSLHPVEELAKFHQAK
jgi:hypothetical protein